MQAFEYGTRCVVSSLQFDCYKEVMHGAALQQNTGCSQQLFKVVTMMTAAVL
jgi:hypothetical protein